MAETSNEALRFLCLAKQKGQRHCVGLHKGGEGLLVARGNGNLGLPTLNIAVSCSSGPCYKSSKTANSPPPLSPSPFRDRLRIKRKSYFFLTRNYHRGRLCTDGNVDERPKERTRRQGKKEQTESQRLPLKQPRWRKSKHRTRLIFLGSVALACVDKEPREAVDRSDGVTRERATG